MMVQKILLALSCMTTFAVHKANADHLHEIRVYTSHCDDCGMAAFFGQLSVKVFKIVSLTYWKWYYISKDIYQSNFDIFILGTISVFAGDSLKECYNFDMGAVSSADDIGKCCRSPWITLKLWIIYFPQNLFSYPPTNLSNRNGTLPFFVRCRKIRQGTGEF